MGVAPAVASYNSMVNGPSGALASSKISTEITPSLAKQEGCENATSNSKPGSTSTTSVAWQLSNPTGSTYNVNSIGSPSKSITVGCATVLSSRYSAGSHSQSYEQTSPLPAQVAQKANGSKFPEPHPTEPSDVKTMVKHPDGLVAMKSTPVKSPFVVTINGAEASGPSYTDMKSQHVSRNPPVKLRLIMVPSPGLSGQ